MGEEGEGREEVEEEGGGREEGEEEREEERKDKRGRGKEWKCEGRAGRRWKEVMVEDGEGRKREEVVKGREGGSLKIGRG